MNRRSKSFLANNLTEFKKKALLWANTFDHCTFFNNNDLSFPFSPFPNFIAADAAEIITFDGKSDFEKLKDEVNANKDWLVGYLGYDLKNQVEKLTSNNLDLTGFPDIYFYRPSHLVFFNNDEVKIESTGNPQEVFDEISKVKIDNRRSINSIKHFKQEIGKKDYLNTVNTLRNHIIEGDIYEVNFCIAFHTENADLNPLHVYSELIGQSPTPFSVFQKIKSQYLLCASPERFLKKSGNKLISQPIKGTIQRGSTPKEDEVQKQKLQNDEKERAENMMIVDLVRNDLARSCQPGSVKVEEMFGIYPFRHLHQMISTVTGELRDNVHFIDAVKNAFPMGSMTGAPKIKAMELIEQYELNKRGLFSGAVGFITPNGDFDFNVVIRSIFYNASSKKLSFQAGSAITYDSIPEKEYEECMLKVKAIKEILVIN